MKRTILICGFSLSCLFVIGQELELDSLPPVAGMIIEDSVPVFNYETPGHVEFIPGNDNPDLIRDRLSCITKTIPLHYNDRVHAFINYFTVKDREYTRMVARRQGLYFPLFEKYLAKYNLPDELKYLSIVESGLNPKAISRARAAGLWQFISATGKHYGLQNNWYIDERMDPDKATDAACRFLSDLYGMFGDWELAIAAYNTGPGNVKKAIRRAGYKKSFWEIYPYLYRETRSYLPQYVAIIYAMNYLDEHNFQNIEYEVFPERDTITVTGFLHLETFAKLTETCYDDLLKLNPAILRGAIPDNSANYVLHVPQQTKLVLEANRLAILDSASKTGKTELEALAKAVAGNTYGRERITYRVKSGDVLGAIAIRHGVSVADIKEWNNLSSNMIRIGQNLSIWVKSGSTTQVATARVSKPIPVPEGKVYIVQDGDTLWDISKKFEGLSITTIKELNNLSSDKIHPGQKLVIGI